MTPAPEYLNQEARACWHRVQSRLLARGMWEDIDVFGLEVLAKLCAEYLEDARGLRARELRRLAPNTPDEVKAIEKICDEIIEDTRLMARKWLAEYMMITAERVPLATLNAEGLDGEIADLCAPWNE